MVFHYPRWPPAPGLAKDHKRYGFFFGTLPLSTHLHREAWPYNKWIFRESPRSENCVADFLKSYTFLSRHRVEIECHLVNLWKFRTFPGPIWPPYPTKSWNQDCFASQDFIAKPKQQELCILAVWSGRKRLQFTSTHFQERRDHYIYCIGCWEVVLKAGKIGTMY